MTQFKDIELEDKELMTSSTLNSPRQNYDLSFSNSCSWHFLYNTKFTVMDSFLLSKSWAEGELTYIMPVGNGDLSKVLSALIEDANREGEPFCLLGICAGTCVELGTLIFGKLQFAADGDYADYIYLHSDLVTLSGKKFQAKRSHVSRFRKAYNYEYTPMTAGRIQECPDLGAEWCRTDNCNRHGGTGSKRRALIYALHNLNVLRLTGGIFHVEDEIAAFTFGMPINQNTFEVHAERADANINGAYAMINYGSTNHISEQYIYTNREEDLGTEGLRKAKLPCQPAIILEKYMTCLKERPVGVFKQ